MFVTKDSLFIVTVLSWYVCLLSTLGL